MKIMKDSILHHEIFNNLIKTFLVHFYRVYILQKKPNNAPGDINSALFKISVSLHTSVEEWQMLCKLYFVDAETFIG